MLLRKKLAVIVNGSPKILKTILFFIELSLSGFNNPFRDDKIAPKKKLLILANGPSLKYTLKSIQDNIKDYQESEFSVVNDFVHEELFQILKPKYYTLSDPMFFTSRSKLHDKGLKVMHSLAEKVHWDMNLYVRTDYADSEYLGVVMKNPYIHIVYYYGKKYNGLDFIRNWIFKNGWGNGEYSTVILNSIYCAITMGFKHIELYGVDHTFFDGLSVNDDNIPCYIYRHSYDNEMMSKPIMWSYDHSREYMDMLTYLKEKVNVFTGHKIMSEYAKYMGCRILNCTVGSLIDAYPRKKEIK